MPTNFLSFEISFMTLKIGFTLRTNTLTMIFHIEFIAKITKKINVVIIAFTTHSWKQKLIRHLQIIFVGWLLVVMPCKLLTETWQVWVQITRSPTNGISSNNFLLDWVSGLTGDHRGLPYTKRFWWQLCNPTTAKPKVRKKDSARVSHTSPLPTLSLAVLYNDNA